MFYVPRGCRIYFVPRGCVIFFGEERLEGFLLRREVARFFMSQQVL